MDFILDILDFKYFDSFLLTDNTFIWPFIQMLEGPLQVVPGTSDTKISVMTQLLGKLILVGK